MDHTLTSAVLRPLGCATAIRVKVPLVPETPGIVAFAGLLKRLTPVVIPFVAVTGLPRVSVFVVVAVPPPFETTFQWLCTQDQFGGGGGLASLNTSAMQAQLLVVLEFHWQFAVDPVGPESCSSTKLAIM